MWFRKAIWYITGVVIELRQIFILLIFSYLAILINLVILRLLSEPSIKDVMFRYDMLNSTITTSITLIFATQVININNEKIKDSKGYFSILIILFSILISAFITINQELQIELFNKNIVNNFAILLIIVSILIIIISRFNVGSIKQFVEQQQKGYDSNKISTTEVNGKNIDLD